MGNLATLMKKPLVGGVTVGIVVAAAAAYIIYKRYS